MALTQGLSNDPRYAGMVALADLSLDADLALLHDARDIFPGVQELVEAHRAGHPSPEEIRRLTFAIANRNYYLLLGLRRHRDWAALRPRAFEASIDGLRRTFRMVVADTDPDLEGEDQCGSYEVEERNLMARTAVMQADVVIAVGVPGVKGLHGLVRTVNDLRDHGVPAARILPVINACQPQREGQGRADALVRGALRLDARRRDGHRADLPARPAGVSTTCIATGRVFRRASRRRWSALSGR